MVSTNLAKPTATAGIDILIDVQKKTSNRLNGGRGKHGRGVAFTGCQLIFFLTAIGTTVGRTA